MTLPTGCPGPTLACPHIEASMLGAGAAPVPPGWQNPDWGSGTGTGSLWPNLQGAVGPYGALTVPLQHLLAFN